MSSNGTQPVAFTYLAQMQQTYKPPLMANDNAFLGDVASSDAMDAEKPITCGFYRLEKGTPLVYEYTYHEVKIVLDGHFYIADETGQKVKAVKGDVLHIPKGAKITFTTDEFGLAFYAGQRAKDSA